MPSATPWQAGHVGLGMSPVLRLDYGEHAWVVEASDGNEGDFFLLKLERHGTLFHHEWLGSETGRESCRSRGSTYLFLPWLVLGSGRLSTGIWHGSAKPWPGHHDAGRTGRH